MVAEKETYSYKIFLEYHITFLGIDSGAPFSNNVAGVLWRKNKLDMRKG